MFDVEAALVAWLPGAVGVPCFADVPDPRPETFLTVERTGGSSSLGVDRPGVAVQAWAPTRERAANLALTARDALILRSIEVPQICRCSVDSVYNFPDPDSRGARYQLSVSLVCRP